MNRPEELKRNAQQLVAISALFCDGDVAEMIILLQFTAQSIMVSSRKEELDPSGLRNAWHNSSEYLFDVLLEAQVEQQKAQKK